MLPWFQDQFPLYLAPMAGVTDTVFRRLCKEQGADVVVTEFVSAEGIFRRNARTLGYLDFHESERPLGVQLFGGDPDHLGEAARMVVEWKGPDFVDLNFGCPVNKVVSKNGGSSLLRDCPLLERVARAVVRAAAPCPVTAKIRIGWDRASINAVTTARALEGAGVQAIAVHGRTKEQGYGGEADWDVIGEVVGAVGVPVIGNGDLTSAATVAARREQTGVAGVMLGRGWAPGRGGGGGGGGGPWGGGGGSGWPGGRCLRRGCSGRYGVILRRGLCLSRWGWGSSGRLSSGIARWRLLILARSRIRWRG